jgi:alpha-tubulin suppressor-like RCC1 family protein
MGIKGKYRSGFDSPQLITKLNGEDIAMTSIGANHAVALSKGGDVFSWGKGDFGVLGSGELKTVDTPKFMDCFATVAVDSISCGEQHTCIKTSRGDVYVWGRASNGRLGIGCLDAKFQPSPLQVQIPQSHVVNKIACGSEHTLISTLSTVFSFGSGDGGRLGHGPDHSDRVVPTEIVALRGSPILDISAGTW